MNQGLVDDVQVVQNLCSSGYGFASQHHQTKLIFKSEI